MRRISSLLAALCLLTSAPCARAQDAPPAAPAAAPPSVAPATLAQALAQAAAAPGEVCLSVAAEAVALPDGGAAPGPDAGLPEVAAAFRRTLAPFGAVTALAPPTMTVLNTSPDLAELPLGDLAGQHPEAYLLGSLTPGQLQQAGTDGLAYADMTPDQQSLMRALLPEPLEIVPASASLPDWHASDAERKEKRAAFDAQIQKVSGDALFGALRLHLYLTGDFYVRAPTGSGIGDTRDLAETTGAYKLPVSGYPNMESRGKGTAALLQAEVPNAPKPGDLDWGRGDLSRTVTLGGLKTVDGLTARLARATGLELYADTHYGPQALTLQGDTRTPQPAGDVMQALALCVCGTWRRVGSAYVLTDDVQGLGTRQQFLAEMGQVWSNRLSQAGKDAGARLQSLDWLHALSFVPGDPGALSPAQVDAIQKQGGGNVGDLVWKDLPPALRSHLSDHFLHYGDDSPAQQFPEVVKMGQDMRAAAGSVRPDSPVETTLDIRLAVELPGTGAMMLYGDYRVQSPAAVPHEAPAPAPPPVTLAEPLRAVLCAPQTPAEARATVASLRGMGLNALFLDVFTGGPAHLPADAAAGILRAALDAAGPLHVPVYAALDALCWRKDGLADHSQPWPAGYQEDVTISGETPEAAIRRRVSAGSLSADYDHPRLALAGEGARGWASPLDPAVRDLLPALAGTLAGTNGLAGLVFQDTVPPGYGGYEEPVGLGYALPSRLAYLRRTHQDPIDLSPGFDEVSVFVSGEFFFGHYPDGVPTFAALPGAYAAWSAYRAGADRSLLAACWRSARAAAPALPLLRRTGRGGGAFVPWTAPDQAAPSPQSAALAPQTGQRGLVCVSFGPDEQAHPERFAQAVRAASGKGVGDRAAGIVFDLGADGTPGGLADSLDRLGAALRALAPPKAPAATK